MASGIESRLTEIIRHGESSSIRGVAAAELACYFARAGEFERAEEIRVKLRTEFGLGTNPRVSIYLMLLDGLLLYFKDLGAQARDRINRANVISRFFGVQDLCSLTHAWLAHIDFNLCDFPSMSREFSEALKLLHHDDGTAKLRLLLVLGDGFSYCDKSDLALEHYQIARDLATKLGDQAGKGAITYNLAALSVQNLRFQSILEEISSEQLERVESEVQTAVNYQRLVRLKSLDHLLSAAEAGVLMLREDWAGAERELGHIFDGKSISLNDSGHLMARASLAKCQIENGAVEKARLILGSIADASVDSLDSDDKAIFHGLIHEVALRLGVKPLDQLHYLLARQAANEHQIARNDLFKSLQQLASAVNLLLPVAGPLADIDFKTAS